MLFQLRDDFKPKLKTLHHEQMSHWKLGVVSTGNNGVVFQALRQNPLHLPNGNAPGISIKSFSLLVITPFIANAEKPSSRKWHQSHKLFKKEKEKEMMGGINVLGQGTETSRRTSGTAGSRISQCRWRSFLPVSGLRFPLYSLHFGVSPLSPAAPGLCSVHTAHTERK